MKLFGKRTREVAERIIEAFRHPEDLPAALAPILVRRNDHVPCRRWSWPNQLAVALNGTSDARGFRQWEAVGRHVRKGSKALWILAPCVRTVTEQDEDGKEAERHVVYGFRSAPVFAVEDTEGEPLPANDDRYAEWVKQLPLVEVAEAWDVRVDTFTHRNGNPLGYYRYGSSRGQAIMLGTENLATWAHELIHAADHRVSGLHGKDWHKEIVAELGSATLLRCLGLEYDADLGGAFAYIARYAAQARLPTVKACIGVLDRVCESVKLVLDTAERLQHTAPAQG